MTPEAIVKRYNFARIGDDGVLEFYCDHSLLSAFRSCEQYFVETYLRSLRTFERNWNLDFGSVLHAALEVFYHYEYYKMRRVLGVENKCMNCGYEKLIHDELPKPSHADDTRCNNFEPWESIPKGKFIAAGLKLWDKFKMDYFAGDNFRKPHKMYESLQGSLGFAKLLSDYWTVYGEGKERLRVVAIETPFGKAKEVPIVDTSSLYWDKNNYYSGCYRAFLTGRFDQLVDDGISIAPLDHKSTAFFNGSEATKFNPHDGMLGYAYAAMQLVKHIDETKAAPRVIINQLCVGDNTNKKNKSGSDAGERVFSPESRFTRITQSYTHRQLEEYRQRQAASFDVLYQILVLERPAQWNTGNCMDMYHKDCPFKDYHSLDPVARDQAMKNQLQVVEDWNPFYESKAEIL